MWTRQQIAHHLRDASVHACATYTPDHNAECTVCDEDFLSHVMWAAADALDPANSVLSPSMPRCVCGHRAAEHRVGIESAPTEVCQDETCRCQHYRPMSERGAPTSEIPPDVPS